MVSVLPARPLSYAVLPEGRRSGGASAVHEPNPAGRHYRASSTAPAVPSARTAAPRRSLDSSTRGCDGKTVERLVAERDWEPPRPCFAHNQIVELRVAFAEAAVRDRVKQAGGTWNPERRVRQLRYDRVIELGLTHRIVDARASNSGCPSSGGEHLHADARPASR